MATSGKANVLDAFFFSVRFYGIPWGRKNRKFSDRLLLMAKLLKR
jgi:hypothetical protein